MPSSCNDQASSDIVNSLKSNRLNQGLQAHLLGALDTEAHMAIVVTDADKRLMQRNDLREGDRRS